MVLLNLESTVSLTRFHNWFSLKEWFLAIIKLLTSELFNQLDKLHVFIQYFFCVRIDIQSFYPKQTAVPPNLSIFHYCLLLLFIEAELHKG